MVHLRRQGGAEDAVPPMPSPCRPSSYIGTAMKGFPTRIWPVAGVAGLPHTPVLMAMSKVLVVALETVKVPS